MVSTLDVIEQVFAEAEWPVRNEPGVGLITGYSCDVGTWHLTVQHHDEHRQLIVHSLFPVRVPLAVSFDMMAFLTRANLDLPVGNFELNLDTGLLRFKSGIPLGESPVDADQARRLILGNIGVMETYFMGIHEIMADFLDVEDAVEAAED